MAACLSGYQMHAPALFAFTDPARTPDPLALARHLPAQSGLIYRTFGDPALRTLARAVVEQCHDRGAICLIAAEPDLALRTNADGVHWPEARLTGAAVRSSPGLISASAHSPSAVRRAQKLADIVFISAVFPSQSPRARHPLGVFRTAQYAKRAQMPVYALGGVNTHTIRRLSNIGVSGVGAVEAFQKRNADSNRISGARSSFSSPNASAPGEVKRNSLLK